jgi:hypothetical protein
LSVVFDVHSSFLPHVVIASVTYKIACAIVPVSNYLRAIAEVRDLNESNRIAFSEKGNTHAFDSQKGHRPRRSSTRCARRVR